MKMYKQSWEFLCDVRELINKWFPNEKPEIVQNFYNILKAYIESHDLVAEKSKNG